MSQNPRKKSKKSQNLVGAIFWPQTPFPQKSQNFETIFGFPMKKYIHRKNKKNGFRPSRASFGFSKMHFLADFGVFYCFLMFRLAVLFPDSSKCLIQCSYIKYTHVSYNTYSQNCFLTPKNSKKSKKQPILAVFELFQAHPRQRLCGLPKYYSK